MILKSFHKISFGFLIMLIITIVACQKEQEKEQENIDLNQNKYFDSAKIDQLDLANIKGFWENNADIDTSNDSEALFRASPGLIKVIYLFSETRNIRISVFNSQDSAVNAMEFRINNVAGIINKGTSDRFKGNWWYYLDGWNSVIFVNQWNIIIEVGASGSKYKTIEELLFDTAKEVIRRVDNLSEVIN